MAHVVPNILPENLVVQRSVPIHGITQLGLRSHPTGSSTLSFIRSDKPVFNTAAFRPCYTTQAVAGPIVSHIRNPYLIFPGGVHHFHRRLDPGRGRPHGDSRIVGVWTRSEHELHINVLELRAVILALHHWATVLQGRHVLIATDNTTVVAYINKQGGTHSNLLLWLVVDLFLLATDSGHNSKSQTHSGPPKCNSRPVVSAKPAHHERVESPPRSRESDIQTVGNSSSGHVCQSPQHASSPVHMSLVPESRALVIDSLSQD